MWVILNVLFLLAVCALLYMLFLGIWLAVLFVFRLRHKLLLSLLSLPVYILLLVGWFLYASRPAAAFEGCFGFAPAPDVSSLRSDTWQLGDSGYAFLRFKASPATIQRIIARGLTPVAPASGPPPIANIAPPSWWTPPRGGTEYVGSFSGRSFAREEEYLLYDAATGEAYFRAIGID